jgi:hypothetical protein
MEKNLLREAAALGVDLDALEYSLGDYQDVTQRLGIIQAAIDERREELARDDEDEEDE